MPKLLILTFIIFGISCSPSHDKRSQANNKKCNEKWECFLLNYPVKGKVLYRGNGICGYLLVPSATLIVTSNNDTIRVLEFCNERKLFAEGDSVLVVSGDSYAMNYNTIPNEFDCKVKRTCAGIITKIK